MLAPLRRADAQPPLAAPASASGSAQPPLSSRILYMLVMGEAHQETPPRSLYLGKVIPYNLLILHSVSFVLRPLALASRDIVVVRGG